MTNLAKKFANSRSIQEFQVIPERFQEWWNSGIPNWKSSSLKKNEWENTQYIDINQTTPKPGNSRIPGILDSRVQKLTGSSIYICPSFDDLPFLSQLTQKRFRYLFRNLWVVAIKTVMKLEAKLSWKAPDEF